MVNFQKFAKESTTDETEQKLGQPETEAVVEVGIEQKINNEKEISTPEAQNEEGSEETQHIGEKTIATIKKKQTSIPNTRDEISIQIEKILEDGLGDEFQKLSPIAQQEFKIKGEETSIKIRELLKSTHVKVKKILRLILEWLRMLPGVNRFYLEQEAKIKADRIFHLKENKKESILQ